MSVPAQAVVSRSAAPSSAEACVSLAVIEGVAEALRRDLNSIQAIAYYVEMTMPLSELHSLDYLRKLQELAEECEGILEPFVESCRATGLEGGQPGTDSEGGQVCSDGREEVARLSEGGCGA